MKLEVGMYVRFNGMISKIINKENDCVEFDYNWYDDWWGKACSVDTDVFIRDYKPEASYNIIDLIEIGDYVNGAKVDNIILKNDKEICFRYKYAFEKEDVYTLHLKDIKTIVTHEQFEDCEYRIGDE